MTGSAADSLLARWEESSQATAVIAPRASCTFAELIALTRTRIDDLGRHGIHPGTIVGVEGEFSPASIALLVALTSVGAVAVPHTSRDESATRERRESLAQVEIRCRVDPLTDAVSFEPTGRSARHALYDELRGRDRAGLVLFTSGTSGEPKAAVHDMTPLLEKFAMPRPARTTLGFLLFDHMGGINTVLHTLANGATLVAISDRSPEGVCRLVEEHRVELLPTTPTFINLLLLSGANRRHDLNSLQVISYGAEPMSEATLLRLRGAFPKVKLQQTYGMIEVGVLRSKSADDGSLWVRIGGDGFDTRVVDGMLEVQSRSMLLGYLNTSAPITPDGWFQTGDVVEQDGEYLRFLGRDSDLINVGGEKVYPAEVEGTIESMEQVAEAIVYGEPHAFVGQIVCARVVPAAGTEGLAREVKRFCGERLERFKVPVKVEVVADTLTGTRVKKPRLAGRDNP